MERRIEALTLCLESEDSTTAYQLYLMYIKAKGIKQELYRLGYEGVNALFDNPAEAVEAFMDKNIQSYDDWRFMYINSSGDLAVCDEITEKVNVAEMAEWLFNESDIYDRIDICEKLDEMDFPYYFVKVMSGNHSYWYRGVFRDWLDNNDIKARELVESTSWDAIQTNFQSFEEEKLKEYYKNNPHLIR